MKHATSRSHAPHKPRIDPRLYQIATLTTLLVYGVGWLQFDIHVTTVVLTIGIAQATQWLASRLSGLRFDPRSAMISALSLCLLLRTNSLALVAIAACVTIAAKFVFRWNDKHIFNPTNFALVFMMLMTGGVWVSPGQWGSTAYFGFLMACLGGLVVNRATRSDVTYAFLAFYVAILLGRAWWLGLPLSIPLHQLQNGAFLLFAFFMISDPKTTPDSRAGRILFAFLVAAGAALIQFGLFRTNGLLWSLAAFALTVPLIDRLLPGRRYSWNGERRPAAPVIHPRTAAPLSGIPVPVHSERRST